MFLEVEQVEKSFGGTNVVNNVSFGLPKGELLCILGASGCGKTTTLNMIGGFLHPDRGRIILDGQEITALPPERRPVSTVFQSYGLFPHLSVLQNVVYGLKFRCYKKSAALAKGREYLRLVGLDDKAEARIHELSGGQSQRVALARALIVEPKLCLLDEPFSNLDATLRIRLRTELKKLQQELGITMVFVTHDQEEALLLGDRMAIMAEGRLLQYDTPENIYRQPADDFVADFLNVRDLEWRSDGSVYKRIKPSAK